MFYFKYFVDSSNANFGSLMTEQPHSKIIKALKFQVDILV